MKREDISPQVRNLAAQVVAQAPDRFKPTKNLLLRPADWNPNILAVDVFNPEGCNRFVIEYDKGPDLYNVTLVRWPGKTQGDENPTWHGVYADVLGALLFGDEAKPFVPMVLVTDEEGNPI